jgi:hypothetical protein
VKVVVDKLSVKDLGNDLSVLGTLPLQTVHSHDADGQDKRPP